MSAEQFDVVVVGAGAAGVGIGCVLRTLGLERFVLLERDGVGASFRRWPREMRFISPSFTGNGFGLVDLNAVTPDSSPAYTLTAEHPTGRQYARYLRLVAETYELPVETGIDVRAVVPRGGGFDLQTSGGTLRSRFVVWAAGEFQYPNCSPFAGAELCVHNSQVRSWRELPGDEHLIVGGYESGVDAAYHLWRAGKRVRVLEQGNPWTSDSADPSVALSPFTFGRLQRMLDSDRVEMIGDVAVARIERAGGGFVVHDRGGQSWRTSQPPILATGFSGSLRLIANLLDWHAEGYALLTDVDESTRTPGLFVAGPQVRHEGLIFCFIYKFRQRFAVIGRAIARQLGLDESALETYRRRGMFLEDLSCCEDDRCC